MKASIVNPMRNRKYIEEQFDEMERQKILEWAEKHKEPTQPTVDAQLKEAIDGNIIWVKPKKGCSCSRYSHSRSLNVPDWAELISTPSQDTYKKEKAAYDEKQKQARNAIHAERKRRYEAVMFNKEDFLGHAKEFREMKF